MNRVLVADAITMINDKWIEEAAFYSAPAKSKRKRMNIGVKILIAAVLLLSAITVAGAAGILDILNGMIIIRIKLRHLSKRLLLKMWF